jgi:hypothetical protein
VPRITLLLLVLVTFESLAISQRQLKESHLEHLHPTAAPEIIDGSNNPDKVSDLTAYRLYLLSWAQIVRSEPSRAVRLVQLQIPAFSEADAKSFVKVVETFSVDYDLFLKRYESAALESMKNGEGPVPEPLLQSRDLLVTKTRSQLTAVLSPQGRAQVDSTIQAEKRRMKVSVER